jgi:hypothetical protein
MEHIYDLPFEGGIRRWSFESMQTLVISGDVFSRIMLLAPTYIQTSAKVDALRGSALVIHDSHNIGDICASKVVMLNSTAKSIIADEIVLLFSNVKNITVGVAGKLTEVYPSKNGVDSSASFTAAGEVVSAAPVFNEEGHVDFVIHKGKISNPQLTANGKPRLGMINQATQSNSNGSIAHE